MQRRFKSKHSHTHTQSHERTKKSQHENGGREDIKIFKWGKKNILIPPAFARSQSFKKKKRKTREEKKIKNKQIRHTRQKYSVMDDCPQTYVNAFIQIHTHAKISHGRI